jgi:multiple sugar transport system substrate-binding protein/raffinose/stachyose/melibiose transport system substrate-binding protein
VIDASKPIGEDAPTDGFFAAAKAKNVEEAKQWLRYAGSREYQEAAARNLKRIAIHTDVPLEIYDPPTQKGIQLLQSANYIAQFYDRDTTPEMAEKGMNAFIQFWQNPDDIDKILDDLDAERQRIFSAES